jgi:hypothetical protein
MSLEQTPFTVEKLEDAQNLIAREDADAILANLDFYYGDHWQDGEAWSGPIPADTEADYDTIAEEIRRGLGSKNVVKEITDRAGNAVTGRKPVWSIVPNRVVDEQNPVTSDEEKLIAEAKLLLTNWVENKEFQKYLSKALRQAFLAGKSSLRLFIPAGFILNGQVETNGLDSPLDVLEIDAPNPLSTGVTVDPNSRERIAVHLGNMGDDETAELSYLLPERTANGRITEISVLVGETDPEVTSVQLDLGGRLPVHQLEMPRLVTEQIVSMQKALNLNLTMMQRNAVLGGFLERVITNGQLPASYDEQGNLQQEELNVGAGSVNTINGIPIIDPTTGEVRAYTTANVQYKDPVSPETFIKASDFLYRSMLESSDQLHALISGDAAASGESRRQAQASFQAFLRTPQQEVDKAGRWMLETALAYAAFLTEDAGKFKGLRVNYESKLDMGAVPTSEIDLTERLVKVGVISLETARERIGIEQPEVEARRVQKENESGELSSSGVQKPDGTSKVTGQALQNVDNNDITA